MQKRLGLFAVVFSLVLVAGFVATAAESGILDDVPLKDKNISEVTKEYVQKFAEQRDIPLENIKNVSEVDFNALPKEVNIENVNDANLAIYKVDYEENNAEDKQLFVITYSTDQLKAQGDIIIASDKRQFISFGSSDETAGSAFLESATGVEGSLNTGYVMMREGSVTGISTNLKVVNASSGSVEVVVYKNGEQILFGNSFDGSESGTQKDHDIQSNGVVTFQPGDVISAYVKASEETSWDDVITLIEITTK